MDDDARRKGGNNRKRFLSPEDRAEIARAGAQARWKKAKPERQELPKAIAGDPAKPLEILDFKAEVYVLEDERRVLTLGSAIDALGMARGGSMIAGMNRLELFVTRAKLRQHISDELFESVRSPIVFLTTKGSRAYGYETEVLITVAEAVVAAAASQDLMPQQKRIAITCAALLRGFTRAGLISLVDEATGYQDARNRDGLRKIVEAFVSKELLPWTKRFPDEYYREIYRVHRWSGDPNSRRKPRYVGLFTRNIIYDKLPPGVREELETKNPILDETGRRRWKNHQFLTPDLGHPVLSAHMQQVMAILKVSKTRGEFKNLFNRLFPDRASEGQGELDFPEK